MKKTNQAKLNTLSRTTVWLIYDGQCPICASTVKALRIKKAVGKLELINARESHPMVLEVKNAGFNLDEGFVVKIDNRYYHGADALHLLALIGTGSDWLNKLNLLCFRNKTLARILYPCFRAIRNTLLKLKGIEKIGH